MTPIEAAISIAEKVKASGGRTFFVGGYVRDKLLGRESNDIDIEIHGTEREEIERILDGAGERIEIGKSFGIYGIKGIDLDIAMPRTEKNVGKGHRDLVVETDPFAGYEKAAKRRDFTVNALMEDVLTGEIIDCFGGTDDLKKCVLRHVSADTFGEDPLRVLRAARFSATLGFTIAPETTEICKKSDLSFLPKERIGGELKKALCDSEKPSVFFDACSEAGQTEKLFPELNALHGIEQSRVHHPEGDAFVHTMKVTDYAAGIREKSTDTYKFMLSALCHDFGKAITTEFFDGDWHSYDHEKEGLPSVNEFISRISGDKKLLSYVLNMTELHMRPNACAAQNAGIKATNRLFDKSVCPSDLVLLAEADRLGKNRGFGEYLSERLTIYTDLTEERYITGDDLIKNGITDGKEIGRCLDIAHKMCLSGVKKEDALKQILSECRK